jgi:hypothetical protein
MELFGLSPRLFEEMLVVALPADEPVPENDYQRRATRVGLRGSSASARGRSTPVPSSSSSARVRGCVGRRRPVRPASTRTRGIALRRAGRFRSRRRDCLAHQFSTRTRRTARRAGACSCGYTPSSIPARRGGDETRHMTAREAMSSRPHSRSGTRERGGRWHSPSSAQPVRRGSGLPLTAVSARRGRHVSRVVARDKKRPRATYSVRVGYVMDNSSARDKGGVRSCAAD